MNMAASRRLLFGTTLFRIDRNSSATPSSFSNLLPSYSPSLSLSSSFTKPYPFPRFHLFITSYSTSPAASIDDLPETGTETVDVSHPWPEWVRFIDRLKSKGYFAESSSPVEDDDGGDAAAVSSRTDLNQLKNACLSFARERFDICKSLSREDIQTVVKYGCPSLSRKVVNSAKRLRVFVRLDEGDVCSGCNLRGSCDRAYGILKESESAARTVDIVRMLLIYALDPLVHSGEKPNGREHIETSARKLLSELIELSETSPDPALPKPVAVKPTRKPQTVVDFEKAQNIEMKKGDWMCSKCNFMNFARNIRCLQCKEDGPKRVSVDDVEMKKGDWTCPKCTFMNFSRNRNCLRCQGPRPKRQLQPGEWECPSCDFVNFRKNTVCLKCKCDRPRDEEMQDDDQIWKRPR